MSSSCGLLLSDSERLRLLRDLVKHLCSAISYSGAKHLNEMQEMFRLDPERFVIKLTQSSRRESFDR